MASKSCFHDTAFIIEGSSHAPRGLTNASATKKLDAFPKAFRLRCMR